MGQFTGRLVTSCVMFLIALILLVLGYALGNWLEDADNLSPFLTYSVNYYFTPSVSGEDYTKAMRGTLLAAISLTSICLLLSIIMVVADLCFRITQGMAVIPKTTTAFAVIAGLLASITCVLYLVRLYVVEEVVGFIPNYPFFIVLFSGIFLKVAGCVNNGANQAVVVGNSGTAVTVMASQSQSQSVPQPLSAYNLYNQSSSTYGGTNYAPGMMPGSQFQSGMPPGYQQQMFNAPPYIGVKPNTNPEPPQSTLIDAKKSVD